MISILNSVFALVKGNFPMTVNICRPIIMILFFSNMRKNIYNIFFTLYDSLFIIVSIGIYVVIYGMVGYSLYRADY